MLTPSLFRRATAEALGTYFLVIAGCGAIMVDASTGALGHVGVALTFGLVILVMIATFGHLSGAHFNPAVTLALALTQHIRWREIPAYIGAQLIGATLGAGTLKLLLGDAGNLGVTLPAGTAFQAFGIEILLTSILVLVILAVATDPRANNTIAAIAIGGAVTLDALWGGPISGASMNPARSFGPALISGLWQAHWVYWLGPILGAVLAAGVYRFTKKANTPASA